METDYIQARFKILKIARFKILKQDSLGSVQDSESCGPLTLGKMALGTSVKFLGIGRSD